MQQIVRVFWDTQLATTFLRHIRTPGETQDPDTQPHRVSRIWLARPAWQQCHKGQQIHRYRTDKQATNWAAAEPSWATGQTEAAASANATSKPDGDCAAGSRAASAPASTLRSTVSFLYAHPACSFIVLDLLDHTQLSQLFDKDYAKGTQGKSQCLLQFLQLEEFFSYLLKILEIIQAERVL